MALVNEVIMQYWKPAFLLNHNTKCDYELMNSNETLVTVTHEDIDWETFNELSGVAIGYAKSLLFHDSSFIRSFKNGVAEAGWQLNPVGRYFMDEEGFGMTDDEEMEIYGFIDNLKKFLI